MKTYRGAGVDLDRADRLIDKLGPVVTSTWHDGVVGGFGGFAAGVTIPAGYTNPVLMMSTDGVGTKLDLARRSGLYDGVGNDLVAMCVDDLAAAGARPLAFTDYLAVGRIEAGRDQAIVSSIAEACRTAGCALVGGETAEHPGVVPNDHVDLAGAALGVVEKGREISGSGIKPGDAVIGIVSPNLRSNGYSLVRAILADRDLEDVFPGEDRSIAEVLLDPSVIYAPAANRVAALGTARAFVHVTGGGIAGNLRRVLPPGMGARIDPRSWERPNVFEVIQHWGSISDEEMFRVFNMGLGYLVVCRTGDTESTIEALQPHQVRVIGQISESGGVSIPL